MSELLAALVCIGLCILLFKMLARYIALPLVLAVVAGIIGAIFTEGDTWEIIAAVAAGVGLLLTLIFDFENALKTLLGIFVGGLLGALCLYFIHSIWGIDIFLACILIGGLIGNSEAFEDMIGESSSSGVSFPSGSSRSRQEDEEEEQPKGYSDAMGNHRDDEPVNRCRDCAYFDDHVYWNCTCHNQRVSWNDKACHQFSL